MSAKSLLYKATLYVPLESIKDEIIANCGNYNPVGCPDCHGNGWLYDHSSIKKGPGRRRMPQNREKFHCFICDGKGIFEYFDHPLDGSMYEMVVSEQ